MAVSDSDKKRKKIMLNSLEDQLTDEEREEYAYYWS